MTGTLAGGLAASAFFISGLAVVASESNRNAAATPQSNDCYSSSKARFVDDQGERDAAHEKYRDMPAAILHTISCSFSAS